MAAAAIQSAIVVAGKAPGRGRRGQTVLGDALLLGTAHVAPPADLSTHKRQVSCSPRELMLESLSSPSACLFGAKIQESAAQPGFLIFRQFETHP